MKLAKLFIFLTLFAFVLMFFSPKTTYAASSGIFSSPDNFLVKAQETIEYFFAFKVQNKVSVLEKHAEKRLVAAQDYAEEGNEEKVQNMLQDYQQIKDRQNNLLGKTNDENVLGQVAEQTINQQKTMEEIKTKTQEDVKQEIIQVQEQVVNQVAKRVIDTNGTEGASEFLNEVAHTWAPGTEAGGGEVGVIVEGGELKFAPGTSAGGPSGADIKTVEVKTGGGEVNEVVENHDGNNLAPGTIQGGTGGNTIDPGGIDPGDPGTSPN